VEIDEKAVRSYNAMFKKELTYKTQSVVGWDLKPDILIHGSPCQDFSIAGQQKGADPGTETKSSLMWETIRIIQQMGVWKPKYVIWENVKNVLSKHMIHNFNRYLSEMQKMGYVNSFEILDARDFGLPQARQRVFTISSLDGVPFDFDELVRTPMKDIREFTGEYRQEHIVTQPSVLKAIGLKGIARATVIEDYAYTITTKQMRLPAQVLAVDGKYRYLTELECWRLQGYSDEDYYNSLSVHPGTPGKLNGALYKQAGNSIPVTIFESIFRKMLLGEIQEAEEQQLKII
jgi:DNA (cytosine-5)-methyltransferase 1